MVILEALCAEGKGTKPDKEGVEKCVVENLNQDLDYNRG